MKEYVTIPKGIYNLLLEYAAEKLDDVETGVNEGVYDDDEKNQAEIDTLKEVISTIPITPEVYVYVEGGNIQGASANVPIVWNLFDKDNFDAEENDGFNDPRFQYHAKSLDEWNKMIEEGTEQGTLIGIY